MSVVPSKRIWTIPNVLSFLRLGSVPVFIVLFVNERENAAVTLYAIAAWTDFFDGYLARRLDQVSELGVLLDPLADRVFITALTVALVATDVLPLWLAVAIVGRDVLLLGFFAVMERRKIQRVEVNFTGKTATASLLFGLTWLAVSETGFFLADIGDELGIAFTVLGAILYWVASFMYARLALNRLHAS